MQFSFKYCIDSKDHMSEEEYKAIAVEGAIWPKLQPDAKVELSKTEEYHLNIKTLQLCLWIKPSLHLIYGNVCKRQQINLRCTLQGC